MIEQKKIKNLIVSLTSFPARINTISIAITSIINQSIMPEKLILWLANEQFPNKENDLPQELLNLKKRGLIISWCEDIKSYKKLIPTLRLYPEAIIVTADDDTIYPNYWLENLYNAYLKQPNMIHCHRAHRIIFDKNKNLKKYINWIMCINNVKPSFNNFFTGIGGVLYPPNCLYADVLDTKQFMMLAPNADDVWFWSMAVLNNTLINVIKHNCKNFIPIENNLDIGLVHDNVCNGQNDVQINNVIKKYSQILEKLDKRKFYNLSFKQFIQNIFSITNSPDKFHKVISILGIKIKLRKRKRK